MTIFNLHSQLYLPTGLIEYLTVLLEYLDFCKLGGSAQQAFERGWALSSMSLAISLFETNVSHVSHASAFLVSLFYACAWPIILELFSTKL